jgi:hypothetical protein
VGFAWDELGTKFRVLLMLKFIGSLLFWFSPEMGMNFVVL